MSQPPAAYWAPLLAFRAVSRAWRDAADQVLSSPFGWLSMDKALVPMGIWATAPLAKLRIKVDAAELCDVLDLERWRVEKEAALGARYPRLQVVEWYVVGDIALLLGRVCFRVPVKDLPDDTWFCGTDARPHWCGPVPRMLLDTTVFRERKITVPDPVSAGTDEFGPWPLVLRGPLTLREFLLQMWQAGVKDGENLWEDWLAVYAGGDKAEPYSEGLTRSPDQPGVYELAVIVDAN